MNYNRTSIFKFGNRMSKEVEKSRAFKTAWVAAKSGLVERVSGVTYSNRQKLLEYLDNCQKERIQVSLVSDKGNPWDSNAILVIADVIGQGSYRIGYLPRATAAVITSLMETDVQFMTALQGIVGGYNGQNYGMRIRIQV